MTTEKNLRRATPAAFTLLFRVILLIMSLTIAGCDGSGDGLDENGRPLGEGGGSDGELSPSLNSIQTHVFTPRCASCHSGAAAPANLRLEDAQTSYANLVGVPASEDSSLLRVEAGNADDSYLIHKLEGTQSVGERMPLNQPPLDAHTIAVIRQWIDEGAAPPEDNGEEPPPDDFVPTIESIQEHVFTPSCASCHSGPTAPLGLSLEDADTSYMNLVDKPAVENPTLSRVKTSDADNSYLIHKLEGTQTVGNQMPSGGQPPLSSDTIAVIRQWIDEGAAPPVSQSAAVARAQTEEPVPRVIATSPPAGGILPAGAANLLVGFDRALDPARVSAANVRLLRNDPLIGAQDVWAMPALANPRTVLIPVYLAEGAYRLVLVGTGASPLTGLDSTAIDGDGDGNAGGDMVLPFTVEETAE